MILQALNEYYQRKASDKDSNVAPEGWEWKEIPFLCVISESGSFKYFKDTREERGKKKRAHPFLVPTLGEKKGNGIKSNMLWENIEYMFGIPVPTPNKSHPDKKRIKEQHTAFQNRVCSLTGKTPLIKALRKFVSDNQTKIVTKDENWKPVLSTNQNILLAVENKKGLFPVTDIPEIRKSLDSRQSSKTRKGICLVTGEIAEIVRLEPAIKGVAGSDGKAERAFISFNKDVFCSYRKEKNYNAPVGKSASFAYTTALNMLLGKDSLNRTYLADSSIAFWAEKSKSKSMDINIEEAFQWTISPNKDNPDKGIGTIKAMFDSVHSGKGWVDEGNRFYILGLSPSAARISVRFWKVGTTKSVAEKITMHFDDFQIIHGPEEREHLSLYQILASTAFQYKMDNVPPNLASSVLESIIDGSPYPITLLQQCIRRIRAERHVNRARAAILKAHINRFNRFHKPLEKEVNVSLDKTNTNPGYLLGRLFAVLEKVQEEAMSGINATIRDRFYGAASSSPVTVFSQLLKLKNHHLAKLENVGRKVNFERLIGEICDGMQSYPAHLALNEQAYFSLGYYHQRQDFFVSKKISNDTEKQ